MPNTITMDVQEVLLCISFPAGIMKCIVLEWNTWKKIALRQCEWPMVPTCIPPNNKVIHHAENMSVEILAL